MSSSEGLPPSWKTAPSSWVADSTNDLPTWLENPSAGLITGNIVIHNAPKRMSPTFPSRSN